MGKYKLTYDRFYQLMSEYGDALSDRDDYTLNNFYGTLHSLDDSDPFVNLFRLLVLNDIDVPYSVPNAEYNSFLKFFYDFRVLILDYHEITDDHLLNVSHLLVDIYSLRHLKNSEANNKIPWYYFDRYVKEYFNFMIQYLARGRCI